MEKNQSTGMNDRIIGKIKERLEVGRMKYGSENVALNRNFTQESLEEILDCCVYVSCALIEYEQSMKFNNKDRVISDLDAKCKNLEQQIRLIGGMKNDDDLQK